MLDVVLGGDGAALSVTRREPTVVVNVRIIQSPFRLRLTLEERHQGSTHDVLQLDGIGRGTNVSVKGAAVGEERHGLFLPHHSLTITHPDKKVNT